MLAFDLHFVYRLCLLLKAKIKSYEGGMRVASVSRKYLIEKENVNERAEISAKGAEAALIHGTSINLVPLLIISKLGIDRLPVFYVSAGKA
jgi:hypothetical protein